MYVDLTSLLHRLAAPSAQDTALLEDTEAAPGQVIDRSLVSVLVVDDNDTARYALARGMRHLGFRTAEAATGAQAIELSPFCSVVLLDVKLPDVFGTEVCKLLRASPQTANMPIFHISSAPPSGHGLDDVDVSSADGYFVAPADLRRLAAEIDRLLAARGFGQE